MATIYDVDANKLIERAAIELEKVPELKEPSWAKFAKTGAHKERAPENRKWWYVRLAAVLRSTYAVGPVGVQSLRRKYGGKKNRGSAPERTYKGSGSIARKSLQQLEKAGLVNFTEKGVHKGRVITPKGKSFLDKISVSLYKEEKKTAPKADIVEIKTEPVKKPAEIPRVEEKK